MTTVFFNYRSKGHPMALDAAYNQRPTGQIPLEDGEQLVDSNDNEV